jgi:NADPH-dependent curcumin reductase CurA
MKSGGRILVVGSISTYNATDEKKCNLYTVLIKFSNAIEF